MPHIDFCTFFAAASKNRGPEEASDNLEVQGCLRFVTLQRTFFISATSVAMERRNSKAVLYILTQRELLIAVDKCLRSSLFFVFFVYGIFYRTIVSSLASVLEDAPSLTFPQVRFAAIYGTY